MLTLHLTETGKEFQVSCELLWRLAESLPDTENYRELTLTKAEDDFDD